MTTQAFSLATVLTITTDRLLCPMAEVYTILNHMTDDNLFTHQLPRAMRECAPWLLRWFPHLGQIDGTTLDTFLATHAPEKGIELWLVAMQAQFVLPSTFDVGQIPKDDHTVRDPIEEAIAMMGKDRVIVVQPEEDEL